MNNTPIEWCDCTWNPITGCPGPKVSPGCANCYAERMANTRLRHLYSEERPFEHIHFHPERLDQPRKLKKPSRIFVGSMCDLFHDDVEVEVLEPVFWEFSKCPQHTFMLLTKRPEKMRWWFSDGLDLGALHPNVWVGVTVCTQQEADEKIPVLLDTPAAKRFVSVEPMLGPVSFKSINYTPSLDDDAYNALTGFGIQEYAYEYPAYTRNGPKLDWVICGGETGPSARPMHPDWVRSLRDQCAAAGVPFFFKGWGEWHPWGEKLSCGNINLLSFRKNAARYVELSDAIMSCVGKARAGRLLDGVEYNEVPLCPNL